MSYFPENFIWGAASSAYQIEGAAFEDGKGPSIWDSFSHRPGKILQDHHGDVACDHYHRYREDVALMKEMELQAYRFSISWPRVLPQGKGAVNQKGLDFYSRLVDELLAAGIEPWITLHHWDLPQDLFYYGGWFNREIAKWFADFTAIMAESLSDRVDKWMTINEIQCILEVGMGNGDHAPGFQRPIHERLYAGHNILLAHGRSVTALRQLCKKPPVIGMAPVGIHRVPASESAEDIEAARQMTFSVNPESCWSPSLSLDPVFLGQYPEGVLEALGKYAPEIGADDMKIISQELDYCAMNVYWAPRVKAGINGEIIEVPEETGHPINLMHWPIIPDSLYWGPRLFYERYKKPIYISENGTSTTDWVSLDGKVHDPQRIDYTQRYLKAFSRCHQEGIPIGGYFHWSIMDNFEWGRGYTQRMGMIHVNYETQKRILKDSAYFYRDVIRTKGARLFD